MPMSSWLPWRWKWTPLLPPLPWLFEREVMGEGFLDSGVRLSAPLAPAAPALLRPRRLGGLFLPAAPPAVLPGVIAPMSGGRAWSSLRRCRLSRMGLRKRRTTRSCLTPVS